MVQELRDNSDEPENRQTRTTPTIVGTCEVCGDVVRDYGTPVTAYTCGRCGRWVCSDCGGYTPGYGYGAEDEYKYGKICLECYYDLHAEYAERWEAEFGTDRLRGLDNPYDLSDEEDEWRSRMREYKAWRDSRGRDR